MKGNYYLNKYSKEVGKGLADIINARIFDISSLSYLLTQIQNLQRTKNDLFYIEIPRDEPLKIVKPDHDIISHIEISCKIKGSVINNIINYSKYSIEVNLWSDNPKYCYRKELDSKEIGERAQQIGFRRIFLRFHFDMRSEDSEIREPLFHFHVGGAQVEKDCYMWLPEELSEPRFPYPPMDPLLIIDLILRNFCLRSSYAVIETPKWREAIKMCHEMFQQNHDQYSLHSSFFCEN